MSKIELLNNSIYQNNINNVKSLINSNPELMTTINANGDYPLHSVVRYSQVAYNNNEHVTAKKYQKIADLLVNHGAKLNTSNQFNDSVILNPEYETETNVSPENNVSSDSDSYDNNFFTDTIQQISKSEIENVNHTGGYVSENNSDTLSDILNNYEQDGGNFSETSEFNQIGLGKSKKQVNSSENSTSSENISVSINEEELVYETTQNEHRGGARRRKSHSSSSSSRRRSRVSSARKGSKKRKVSRKDKVSRDRKSSRALTVGKLKRGANAYMVFLKKYRASLGANPGKATEVAKKGGKIWRDAKAKAGENASKEDIVKVALSMI
jgi:hypothetical protein